MGKNQTINDMMENCRIKIWNASSDEIIRTRFAPFGYTNESVQQLSDEVSQLNILKENREKESGDAQYAVKERNAKIDELYEFCNELTRLAKLIFQDDESQYLEKLGILARS